MPCGTFSSNTMIVMMIAITPSLNASSRPLVMRAFCLLPSAFCLVRSVHHAGEHA